MAFPTAPILDDFNRPGEGPPPSAMWRSDTSAMFDGLKVGIVAAANQCIGEDMFTCTANWSVITGPDCEAYVDIPVIIGSPVVYLGARISSHNASAYTGYYVTLTGFWDPADPDFTIHLYRVSGGLQGAEVLLGRAIQEHHAGDSLGLCICGDELSVYYKLAAGAWPDTPIIEAIDATYPDAGFLTLAMESGEGDRFDNFGGGDKLDCNGNGNGVPRVLRRTRMGSFNPAVTLKSRVFLIEGGARADHAPAFKSCLRLGAPSWAQGDVTKIECPSPNEYEAIVEVGEIQGEVGRPETSIIGHYALDEESDLLRLTKARCRNDVQTHLGECTSPSDFETFKKAMIWEMARFSNWSADEIGTLDSAGNAAIDETADLSARDMYEVLPMAFAKRGGDVVTNPLVDVVICDAPSCGDCEEESDGCQKIYAVDDGATGSPGTASDLVYSADKAATVAVEDIGSLAVGEAASALACVGNYVVVVSNASNSLHYKLRTAVGDGLGGWVEVGTGFVVSGEPNDIWSVGNYAFVVGDGGYVYGTDDPTAGVSVLDAGVATTDDLNAVHALDEDFAVGVGDSDTIVFTQNGTTWAVTSAVTGGGNNLLCVWIVDEREWWVGDDAGNLYYTLDGAQTWSAKALPGAGWTAVNDVQFATKSVGRLVADKSGTPRAYVLETISGGYTWTILERSGANIPQTDSLVALAVCSSDVNFMVAVGTDDDATDGVFLAGED